MALMGLYSLCFYFVKGESILADSGTEQLEFIVLSQRTGDPKYQQKVFNFDSTCSIFKGTSWVGVVTFMLVKNQI